MNWWVIWHNVTLDVYTELLEHLNDNEQSTAHLGAHYVVYNVTDVLTYQMLSRRQIVKEGRKVNGLVM